MADKIINTSGKRKTAVARATLKKGNGKVKINNFSLESYEPEMYRLRIQEPLILAGNASEKVDISINVFGGGFSSQAEACRLAIGRALAEYDKSLEKIYEEYDRHLLVADVRRKESAKPNRHGQARSKVQKSYR